MYGYSENSGGYRGGSEQGAGGYPEMSLAETIGSSIAPVRLPSSPSQFEAVYMDMGALSIPAPGEPSPPHYSAHQPHQQVVGSWEDDFCQKIQVKQEEQSDSGSDWGGSGSVTTEESPPKSRRGRLPMNDESLTPYEKQKKERRREQNRRAARKCREKRRQHQDVIFQDYYRLKDENVRLREENARIAKERDRLSNLLHAHQATCTIAAVPASQLPPASHHHHHHHQQQQQEPEYHSPAAAALPPHSPLTAPPSTASTAATGCMDQSLDEIADFVFEAESSHAAPNYSSH